MSIWQLNSSRATIYHHHSVYFWGSVSHNISQRTAANQRGNDSSQAQLFYIWYFYLLLSDRAVIFFLRDSTTPMAELKVCLATQRDCDPDLFPIISLLVQGWDEQPLSCHTLSCSLCYINTYIFFLLKFFSFAACKRQTKASLSFSNLWIGRRSKSRTTELSLWIFVRPSLSFDYKGHW